MTEEEREEGKAKIQGVAKGIGRLALYGIGLVALVLIGGMGLTVLSRKNKGPRR
jgi:hypothetical protein